MTPSQENQNVAARQKDQEILAQVKKQRSPAERVDVEQMVAKVAEDYNMDANTLQMALVQLVQTDPKFRIFRYNNTFFFTYRTQPDTMEILVESMDKPRDFVDAIKQAAPALKKIGVKKVVGDITNPIVLKAYQMAGLKYTLNPGKGVIPGTNLPQNTIVVEA
jgi:hypothetical protein